MSDFERALSSEWVELFLLWLDTPFNQRGTLNARMGAIDEALGL